MLMQFVKLAHLLYLHGVTKAYLGTLECIMICNTLSWTRLQMLICFIHGTLLPTNETSPILFSASGQHISSVPEGSQTTVVTVEGGRAEMPCDISAPALGDSVYLVLWYRKDSGTPIYRYSYDLLSVWTDWTICCTLGNFSKPVATIILPKLPTF